MKRMLAAIAAGAGMLLAYSAPALASTTGTQSFTIVGQDSSGIVIGSGPVFGVGQDIETGDITDTFVFPQGSILINHPETSDNSSFNPIACIGLDQFAGTYTFTSGTGGYAGITGSGTFTGRSIFIADRVDGKCADTGTAFFVVNVSGTTTTP